MNLTITLENKHGTVTIERKSGNYILNDLWIRPKHRRKGHGTDLVTLAIRHAKAIGAEKIAVLPEDTDAAMAFWQTFGVKRRGSKIKL